MSSRRDHRSAHLRGMRTATSLGAHRWVVAPVSAGLVLVLLLAAIGAGLRVPGVTYLADLPGFGALDYRTLSAPSFQPLRSDYVNRLLGTDLAGRDRTAAPAAGTAGAAALPAAAPEPGAPTVPQDVEPTGRRGVAQHAFTNDDFSQAMSVRRLPFAARTRTTEATREDGEPTSCASTGGTAWYRYTAKDDRPLVADSFGSDHAVSIGVFRGSDLSTLQMKACSTSPAGDAEVSLTPQGGVTYHFQVTGVVRGGTTIFRLRGLGTMTQVSQGARDVLKNNYARQAALSRDGRFVALEEWGGIWVFDRRTGRRDLITRGYAYYPSLSADGRYVSFGSPEPLVEDDTNGVGDLFVHDRATGSTIRASVSSSGEQGTNSPDNPNGTWGHLSPDGRYVTFGTPLKGLVDEDVNEISDVYVRDLRTGITTLESVDEDGTPAAGESGWPMISDDGRYVVFDSAARNIVPADYSAPTPVVARNNIFRRDRTTGVIELVSAVGDKADNNANRSAMSSNARIVTWTSPSSHLVADDTNGISDVFVRDMATSTVERVSVSTRGEQQVDSGVTTGTDKYQLAAGGRYVAISGDGRYVAFDSRAANLVAQDENRATDVFLHDRAAGSTIRVSVTTHGEEGDGDSYRPRMSLDGQVVAFESVAPRFTRSEPLKSDVFVHDRNGT